MEFHLHSSRQSAVWSRRQYRRETLLLSYAMSPSREGSNLRPPAPCGAVALTM
jgi:hypothetical protein